MRSPKQAVLELRSMAREHRFVEETVASHVSSILLAAEYYFKSCSVEFKTHGINSRGEEYEEIVPVRKYLDNGAIPYVVEDFDTNWCYMHNIVGEIRHCGVLMAQFARSTSELGVIYFVVGAYIDDDSAAQLWAVDTHSRVVSPVSDTARSNLRIGGCCSSPCSKHMHEVA